MSKSQPILTVSNLSVTFGKGKDANHAVQHVSFQIQEKEIFGLAGESGSGKSTIARAIMRLQPTQEGEIYFQNERINQSIRASQKRTLAREIQMVFQNPNTSMNDRAKVYDIVSEGLRNVNRSQSKEERKREVAQALEDVGLRADDMDRFPFSFSGGQLQRIGIARALIMKPRLILFDEPVSSLDLSIRGQILNLMWEIKQKYQMTYLFIAHDLSLMGQFCDRIAILRKGRIVEIGTKKQIFTNPVHPYTRMLLSAVPVPYPDVERGRKLYQPTYSNDTDKEWRTVESGHMALM